MDSRKSVFWAVLALAMMAGTANGQDPCSAYSELNEAWRSVDQVNDGNANNCDSGFNGSWYRFVEPAGIQMPTEAPPSVFRCGTDAPGWMNGAHPAIADGEVSRQVCFSWSNNPCLWSATIQVKACSAGHYVYKLPAPPYCSLTYCGYAARDPCSAYSELNEEWRSVDQVNDGNANNCDSGFNGEWYRFVEPAGIQMPTEAPPSVFRCGTDAPGWMNGEHPAEADGEVSRQVCFSWNNNPCLWSATIQVKACSAGHYVYKLPEPPYCSLTYCGYAEPTTTALAPTTAPDITTAAACTAPFRGFDTVGVGKCLFPHKMPLDYETAKTQCLNMGGKLFLLDNGADVAGLKIIMQSRSKKRGVWIGLTDSATEGQFVWENGAALGGYTDWAPGALADNTADHNCAQMKVYKSHQWVVSRCTDKNAFICEEV